MLIELKQGDAVAVPVQILLNGEPVPIEDVETVELRTGQVRKLWPGEVAYDGESRTFRMPLRQEDTFALPADGAVRFDVRVKFRGGAVVGTTEASAVAVADAVSDKVI